jgi:glycosyltransferase involved in cell wall biosynthesis
MRPMLSKPVLFVTGHAPGYRQGALARLHELEGIEVALFGGRSKHGVHPHSRTTPPFPHLHVRQHEPLQIAASGRHRAVICSTGGRVALPAAWIGARAGKVPLILWSSLWAHPLSAAHIASYPLMMRLYRSADAVVAYGPHVAAYAGRKGASNVHIAPQSVDNAFWAAETSRPSHPAWPSGSQSIFLFAGRPSREKGLGALVEAWRKSGLGASTAALVLVGVGPAPPWVPADGAVGGRIVCIEPVSAEQLRDFYAAADVLVLPSIPTRTFREPWGLVVNEAMNRSLPVIATDAVGAAAGGLLRDRHNGLIVRSGDVDALAAAITELALDADLRRRLGEAGASDVRAYTHDAWANGFCQALASLELSRSCGPGTPRDLPRPLVG